MSQKRLKRQQHTPGKFVVIENGEQTVHNIGSMLIHSDNGMQLLFPDVVMLNVRPGTKNRQITVSHTEANLTIDLDKLAKIGSWWSESRREAERHKHFLPKVTTAAVFFFSAIGIGITGRWFMAMFA